MQALDRTGSFQHSLSTLLIDQMLINVMIAYAFSVNSTGKVIILIAIDS